MKDSVKLTNSEQEVMELLWKIDKALSTNDIINMSETRSWKKSYVHILVNSLLKKKMIKVDGMERSGKNYARLFAPTISKEQYSIQEITSNENLSNDLYVPVMSGMFQKIDDKQVIDELQKELDKRKRELK